MLKEVGQAGLAVHLVDRSRPDTDVKETVGLTSRSRMRTRIPFFKVKA
jgi:hypothetical protein